MTGCPFQLGSVRVGDNVFCYPLCQAARQQGEGRICVGSAYDPHPMALRLHHLGAELAGLVAARAAKDLGLSTEDQRGLRQKMRRKYRQEMAP